MNRIILAVLILGAMLFSSETRAQKKPSKGHNLRVSKYKGNIKSFANKRYLAFGVSVNSLNYFGDLAPKSGWASTDISFTKPGLGGHVEYKYSPRISFFGNLTWGMLKGDDFESADPDDEVAKFRYIRNLQFRNHIIELAGGIKVDLFSNRGTYLSRPVLNPYLFAGIGVIHHNPKGKAPSIDQLGSPIPEAGKWVSLQPLGTEGQYSDAYDVKPYGLFQLTVPVGIGVTYKLLNGLSLSGEVGYRVLFFDHIDDVSGMYVDLGAFDNPLARAMSDRSTEQQAVVSGEQRDFEGTIYPNTSLYTYTSVLDGNTYTVFAGYGSEHPSNIRGSSSDNDIYIVTTIKLTYILGGTFRNAKFR